MTPHENRTPWGRLTPSEQQILRSWRGRLQLLDSTGKWATVHPKHFHDAYTYRAHPDDVGAPRTPLENPARSAARVGAYIARRRRAGFSDQQVIHAYDVGCESEATLTVSDIETILTERDAQQNRIERLEWDLAAHKSREEIYKIKAKAGEDYMSQLEEEKALADALAEDLKSAYLYDADSAADEPASLVAHRKARGL